MYCSNCGTEASGNFCSKCGSPLNNAVQAVDTPTDIDWSEEVRYEVLVRIPEIREKISRHAGMAKKGVSGEDFLGFIDKVVPLGFSLEKLSTVVQPVYAQLGIKTGKEQTEIIASPPGAVIVSAICSLASHGQILKRVRQLDDGCFMEAVLPSDMWSFEGEVLVVVRREGAGSRIELATKIKGQIFDWGKSKRCLEALFSDIKAIPA